jgi:hypothetical protein
MSYFCRCSYLTLTIEANMKLNIYPVLMLGAFALFFDSCKKDIVVPDGDVINTVPEFYNSSNSGSYGQKAPLLNLIANSSAQLVFPQDLDFHPTRPNELWVINKDIDATGGSTVTFTNPGTKDEKRDFRRDGNAWHFMALPSALSFSKNGNWATSANILDANRSGGTFTGPTLWSSDMNVYAMPSGGNGSHLDMLHGSPLTMGIENEKDNVFWVFEGYSSQIVRYDFVADHGPGNDDHSDGRLHRYPEASVKRIPEVPSHLVLDQEKKWLYIVDGGNKRILRMDITTGVKAKDLALINEPLAEHWEMSGAVIEEFVSPSFGLNQPCGIDLIANRLFVSDYATGEIICFDIDTHKELNRINTGTKGIAGIKIGPAGKIWYVNALNGELRRVDPI